MGSALRAGGTIAYAACNEKYRPHKLALGTQNYIFAETDCKGCVDTPIMVADSSNNNIVI